MTSTASKSILFCTFLLAGSWLTLASRPEQVALWRAWEDAEARDDTGKDTTKKYKPSTRPRIAPNDRPGDPFANQPPSSPLLLDAPPGTQRKIELDTTTGNYVIYEKMGELDYRPVSSMTFAEYEEYRRRQDERAQFKAKAGNDAANPLASKSTIPRIYISPMFDRIFGGNYVDIRPNGSVLLDFGYRHQRVYNPSLPIRQQKSGQFLFDQQISLNAQGKIGEKLKININQDTKAAFEFDNTIKLDYTGYDHEILQKIEAGNVSLPISSNLIRGAQNLFGLKTTMQFGRLKVVSVVSNQRGKTEKIVIKNGAQTKEVAVKCNEYEDNRHYFLSQFFRNRYDAVNSRPPAVTSGTNVANQTPNNGLGQTGADFGNQSGQQSGFSQNSTSGQYSGSANIPSSSANSGVQITRIELYVTNRASNTQTLRNIVALQDLGEYNPLRKRWLDVPSDSAIFRPARNGANKEYNQLSALGTNFTSANIVGQTLTSNGLVRSEDFEVVRGARKLQEDRDFTVQRQLGYISLNQQVRDDEVLGVAFEYSYNGQVYKVGELTEDYANRSDSSVIALKLLRPSQVKLHLPTWNLQMKNIYSLGGQISKDNFQMRVIYRDDSSGVDNPALPKGKFLKNKPLVQVMNLDRLNPINELVPDGNFDYIEGLTVDSRNGRIIFPEVEPFGSYLRNKFDLADFQDAALANKYVFQEMYTGTKSDALQAANKAKFFLIGRTQSVSTADIQLGFGVAKNSVVVSSGSQQLREGTDYNVDYDLGRITFINAGVMSSGRDITIQYERADMFSFTQRSFFGSRFDYTLNKDINIGGTLLYQNERPIVRRVAVGDEPARNTMIGLDINLRKESIFLTKMVDALPFIQTKEKSTITVSAEYAHLFPGANKYVDASKKGISFIDDFEAARQPIQSAYSANAWRLSSVPVGLDGKRYNVTDSGSAALAYNDRRAHISWYVVDPLFYNSSGANKPSNIKTADLNNNYIRPVGPQEINKGRDLQQINLNETIFDVAYFPQERGSYNFSPNLTEKGLLKSNPRQNWGGLMTNFTSQTDFDLANVEYIEFWMMDPFLSGTDGAILGNTDLAGRTGGKIVFDLGSISEDVMRDSRMLFENGLPVAGDTASQVDYTRVGRVPKNQILNQAFDNTPGSRGKQDLGLDGLSDASERLFYNQSYLSQLPPNLEPAVRDSILADPANDNYHYFLGGDYDGLDYKVLERYKRYNRTEGNSPEPANGDAYSKQSYNTPDNEDLNRDNTLNEVDAYFSYKVDFDPSKFRVGTNYINDQIVGANGARWFQFRIPIRELSHPNALPPTGGISDFKTIKWMRLYMTGFAAPVVTRFYNLQLVASQWRKYPKSLASYGVGTVNEDDVNFTVSTVDVEQNGSVSDTTQRKIPYVIPPGAQQRDKDVSSGVSRRLDETSLSLCVENLRDGDARAVFKNTRFDFLNYGKVQMFVHADSKDGATKDDQTEVFIRLGTDFTENYYEISVPLKLTKYTPNSLTADNIWQTSNYINMDFNKLVLTKLDRNKDPNASYNRPYPTNNITTDANGQKVSILGNPDLSAVVTVMIGVRNPNSGPVNDGFPKSVCVWVDEFRVTDYIKNDGWAATGTVNTKLADFATVSASGKYVTPGFGSIEQKISERARETTAIYNISSNVTLDRFLPKKMGIKIPMYVAYEQQLIKPQYDPLNPDVKVALIPDEGRYKGYNKLIEDRLRRRSLNFANVQKIRTKEGAKPHIWDIENLSFTFAYSDVHRNNITIASYLQKQINYGVGYNYSRDIKPIEPFKNVGFVSSPFLKLIKDFNFNPFPSNIAVRGDIFRNFTRTQLRSSNIFAELDPSLLTFEKSILFNRTYGVRWAPFRSLTIDYSANANAVVDEPRGDIQGNKAKQDTIFKNIQKGGRLKTFNQTIRFGYKVPFDKLPLTDWLSADLSYTAGINWSASPLALQDTLGNILQNSRDRAINGRVDFVKLYNKVGYLNKINTPPPAAPPKPPPPAKTKEQLAADAKSAKAASIKYKNDRAKLVRQLDLAKRKNNDTLTASLKRQIKALDKAAKGKVEKVKDTTGFNPEIIVKKALRVLMGVRQVNLQYQMTENTVLPGYRPTPHYAGISDKFGNAPGFGFILGDQDPDIRLRAARNGWMGTAVTQTQPFQQAQTISFNANATIEPLRDVRIRLDVRRTQTANYTEIFRMGKDSTTGALTGFQSFSPTRGGGYTVSFLAINTFRLFPTQGDDELKRSKEFVAFEKNRFEVRDRLNGINPLSRVSGSTPIVGDTGYNANSQDVLIPSFIAAYTGKSGKSVGLTNFPSIPLPNWRLDFSGLTRIPWVAERFSSVNITHSYVSNYSVDRFVSSLQYGPSEISLRNSPNVLPTKLNTSGAYIPAYNVTLVTITEKFAPLIGINVRTKNKITLRLDYNRDRALALNVSNAQITEVRSQDVTFGLGFAKSGVKLPLIKDKGRTIVLKNELTLRADFTIRDNATIQRKIGELNQFTAGSTDIQFKPTANYVISQRLNIQFYFERTINIPRISTSYLRKVTAFGFQLRFALQ